MEGVLFLAGSAVLLVAVYLKRRLPSPPGEARGQSRGGSRGEQVIHGMLRSALPASEYTILRDVSLRGDGETTQIDHLVVSRFGIFVIETKDLAGSIIGAEQDGHWIQALQHLRSDFPNPLWQNRANIRALQALLGLRATKFHSLVVFSGRAEFRNPMPLNVMQRDRLIAYFQVRRTPLLAPEAVEQAVRTLESARLESSTERGTQQAPSPRARRTAQIEPVNGSRRRQSLPHGAGFPFATRALAGVASLAVVVAAGYWLIDERGGLLGLGVARPAAFPSQELPFSQSTRSAHADPSCDPSADSGDCTCRVPDSGVAERDAGACAGRVDQDLP